MNERLISTKITDSGTSSRGVCNRTHMFKIGGLIAKLAFLVVFMSSPFIARAGFMDTVSGWFTPDVNTASAQSGTSETKVALLEAAVNTNPTATNTVDSLAVVDGKAFLHEIAGEKFQTALLGELVGIVSHEPCILRKLPESVGIEPRTEQEGQRNPENDIEKSLAMGQGIFLVSPPSHVEKKSSENQQTEKSIHPPIFTKRKE